MESWKVLHEKHNVRTTREFKTLLLYVMHRSALHYAMWGKPGFLPPFCSMLCIVSRTTKESENLPTFLLYGFTVTAAYLSSFFAIFLSSQYINTYGTWLIQLGISKPQFFLCSIILLDVFGFPFYILLRPLLWCGVLWIIVMVSVVFNWCTVWQKLQKYWQ